MWDLVYYVFGASCIGIVGFGILSYVDPNLASDIKYKIGWTTVRTYHKANLKYRNLKLWCNKNMIDNKPSKSDCEDSDEEYIQDKKNITFIGYTLRDNTVYSSTEIENNDYINDTEFSLMFLRKNTDNKEHYKRILDKSEIIENIDIENISKPFIQVEYCVGENATSIHKKMKPFFINNNKILDYDFLVWYMKEFYDIEVEDNYVLKIIDSDINMFNLKKGDYIRIEKNDTSNYLVDSV